VLTELLAYAILQYRHDLKAHASLGNTTNFIVLFKNITRMLLKISMDLFILAMLVIYLSYKLYNRDTETNQEKAKKTFLWILVLILIFIVDIIWKVYSK